MLTSLIQSIVGFSHRFALLVIISCILLAAGSGWYAANHFSINTDVNQLLSEKLPWKQKEKALEQAFPQNIDNLVIVVDADNASKADVAAASLADKLKSMPELFTMVKRPDALPFFRKNGLLYLSKQELLDTLDQLAQAQPLLGMLATDASLRGLAGMFGLMVKGYQEGQVEFKKLNAPFAQIAETVEAALKGADKPLSLESMTGEAKPNPRDLRKFIITKPVLDYKELESGKAARDAVTKAAEELGLSPSKGIRVRQTGSVALADEEFASVADGTGGATILAGVLVITLLLFALRSLRIVVPILFTLVVGLACTLAFALMAIGSLNMISVAFAVMFIGIAVDFGIQFGVRYRDQHHQEPDHAVALIKTAGVIAVPLSMAAASTAIGFLAFMPTDYRGVSELGMIAGSGMVIAFILNITLLPALLKFTKPSAEPEAIGYASAACVDRFIAKRKHGLFVGALLLALVGGAITYQLTFDFDPLNLKDPTTESVSTMFDVMSDPDSGVYAVEVLRPSLAEAQSVADAVSKLPEVDHAMTLASFVPEEQDKKLVMVQDTKSLLDSSMNLPSTVSPTLDENLAALKTLTASLHAIGTDKDHASAEWLATELDEVASRHDENLMVRLQANLIAPLQGRVQEVKSLLSSEAVKIDDIPAELRNDWVTSDGRYRVQIHPKGNPRDHQTLIAFTKAVRTVVPDAAGTPISIQESSKTITGAFINAGIYALVAIALLSLIVLRQLRYIFILLAPLILAGILTLSTIVLIGMPLNFANIIAMPLLLSLGVSYAIYFVTYARSGGEMPLQSSMARAVLFSAATVLVAFGSLAISSHPGTAGMGKLLTVALLYSLLTTFIFLPVLLELFKKVKDD